MRARQRATTSFRHDGGKVYVTHTIVGDKTEVIKSMQVWRDMIEKEFPGAVAVPRVVIQIGAKL